MPGDGSGNGQTVNDSINASIRSAFVSDNRPEYHMRLRVVRFQIAQGVYENIITNLPS